MNRKKTRKWVEAKRINYDGSGWGDEDEDEYEDEYEDAHTGALPQPPPPPPPPPPQQQRPSSRNQSPVPPAPLPSMRPRNSPSPAPPPLHLQTQPLPLQQAPQRQAPQPPFQQQQPQRQPSPVVGSPYGAGGGRNSPQMRAASPVVLTHSPRSGSLPSNNISYPPWREGRPASPLGPRGQSPAGGPGPRGTFIRPAEIYRRAVAEDAQPGAGETDAVFRYVVF